MHFPDQVDGTFPMSGGMMRQCEPDVFEDEALMEAQRTTPMVILHAKGDRVQNPSMSEGAYQRLLGHGFHNVKFLNPSGGHPYDFLPVNEAIQYLDAMTTDDEKLLLKYAQERLGKKDWRTVGMALQHASDLEADDSFKKIRDAFESEASKSTESHLKNIKKGEYGKWVDRFLRWHENFALADSAKAVLEEWDALAADHADAAKALATEASKAFNSRKVNEGWELRKQMMLENFASPQYRKYKSGVEKKFGKLHKLGTKKRR